jgi:hypothetical protein
MALIAAAGDKGAPGVSTASLALAAVWPRPALLAEADPAGGDLVYRLPSADGGRLDPQRGLLSLAVAARRGIQPHQVWEHTQKLYGGLDVLTGVANTEQAGGLQLLWGKIGQVLSAIPQLDVLADCGRLGMDGPFYDLLGYASSVVLVARPNLEGVVRLRDRVAAVAAALAKRGQPGAILDVVIVADYKQLRQATEEVGNALGHGNLSGRVVGGLAYEPKSAEMLRGGQWGGKLDKSMLIRTAREVAAQLAAELPVLPGAAHPGERPRPQHAQAGQLRGGPTGQWPGPPPRQHQVPTAESGGQPRNSRPPQTHHAEPPQPQPAGQPGQSAQGRRPGLPQPQHPAAPGAIPQDQRPAIPQHAGWPGQPQPDHRPQPQFDAWAARPQPGRPVTDPPREVDPRGAQQHHDRLVAGRPSRDQLVAGGPHPGDRLVAGPGQEQDVPAQPREAQQRPGHPGGRRPGQPHPPGFTPPPGPGQPEPQQPGRHLGPPSPEKAAEREREEREQTETAPIPLSAPTRAQTGTQPSESHHPARPSAGGGQTVPRSGGGGDG